MVEWGLKVVRQAERGPDHLISPPQHERAASDKRAEVGRCASSRLDLMVRTKLSQLRTQVEARPGATERLAIMRVETLEEIRLYELRHTSVSEP